MGRRIEPKEISDVKNWINFSTTNHTVDEIIEEIYAHPENICYSYICQNSIIPEDRIDDLIAISTGLIRYDEFKSNKRAVADILEANKNRIMLTMPKFKSEAKKHYTIHYTGDKRILDVKYVRDKLDWYNLCTYQNFSEEFMTSHWYYLVWDVIFNNQKMSQKYFEDNMFRMSKTMFYYETR